MAIRRKKKKNEDLLVNVGEIGGSAQDYVEKNQNMLIGVLAGVLLLVGGYLAYKYLVKAPKAAEASQVIVKAQDYFKRDSFALALTSNDGSYQGMLAIINDYGGTPTGNLANYYAGISYLKLGQFQQAIDYLEDFRSAGEVLPITKYGAIGDAHGELGQLDQAASFYNKAINQGENEFLQSYYLKKLGLLHEKEGDFAKSAAAFERIKKDFPLSPDGADIDKYLSRVQAKL